MSIPPDPIPPISFKQKLRALFRLVAENTSRSVGSPWSFLSAFLLIFAWAISGFYLNFSENWQLIINTSTTIATFLMVILVQNTQYRDARSTQLKLDELLHGTKTTRDSFMQIEEVSDEELDALREEFKELRKKYIEKMKKQQK